jgi:HEAT repeat protein
MTDAFEAVPLEKGLRRLFRGADVSLLYAGSEQERGAERRLVRVWIFARNLGAGSGRDATEPLEASILKATSADSREERWTAVGELANSRERSARDALLAAMRDPEPDVRERAIDALGEFKDEAAIGPLSHALAQDEDEDVRESAADALGEIPSAESVAALKRSLEDESPDVRASAVDGLARIGGPEMIPTLREALSDENQDVRDVAAESLRKLAGGGAAERESGKAE